MSNMSLEEMLGILTFEDQEKVRAFVANLLSAKHTEKRQAWREDFPEQARHLDFA